MFQVLILEPNEIEKLSIKHAFERLNEYGTPVDVNLGDIEKVESLAKLSKPVTIIVDYEDREFGPKLKEIFPYASIIAILYQRLHKGLTEVPSGFDGLMMRETLSPLSLMPWVKLGAERLNQEVLDASISGLNRATEALKIASKDFNNVTNISSDKNKDSLEIL